MGTGQQFPTFLASQTGGMVSHMELNPMCAQMELLRGPVSKRLWTGIGPWPGGWGPILNGLFQFYNSVNVCFLIYTFSFTTLYLTAIHSLITTVSTVVETDVIRVLHFIYSV